MPQPRPLPWETLTVQGLMARVAHGNRHSWRIDLFARHFELRCTGFSEVLLFKELIQARHAAELIEDGMSTMAAKDLPGQLSEEPLPEGL